jgi:hypothetical protein
MTEYEYDCTLCKERHSCITDSSTGDVVLDFVGPLNEEECLIYFCPTKNAKVKLDKSTKKLYALTPRDEAFLEIGKEMLKNSRITIRDFSSSMITISSGAIGVYVALVAFLLPKNAALNPQQSIVIGIPAVLFLISIISFISAYFPSGVGLNLNDVSSISKRHHDHVDERFDYVQWGIWVFTASVVWGIVALMAARMFLG